MTNRRTKKAVKKTSPQRARKAGPAKNAVAPPRAVSAESTAVGPSPEELQELEVSVQRDQARERLLGLAREYPRADRPLVNPLTAVLKTLPGLSPVQARVIAQSLKRLGDQAHDLNEILDRILHEPHDPTKIAELVMAFQLVAEQLGTYTETLGEKLYDLFDRAKGLK